MAKKRWQSGQCFICFDMGRESKRGQGRYWRSWSCWGVAQGSDILFGGMGQEERRFWMLGENQRSRTSLYLYQSAQLKNSNPLLPPGDFLKFRAGPFRLSHEIYFRARAALAIGQQDDGRKGGKTVYVSGWIVQDQYESESLRTNTAVAKYCSCSERFFIQSSWSKRTIDGRTG